MIDKLQEHYNLLIHQSNIQFILSITPSKELDNKRESLQTLAYGFQEAAAMLRHAFPELIYRETMREKEIREHHIEELRSEGEQPRKINEEA